MPKLLTVKISLKFPGVAGVEGTWEPDEAEVNAAWDLYVEMVTRTPLGEPPTLGGSARERLTSIHSLFDTTRNVLRRHGPSVARPKKDGKLSFAYLAVTMLNLALRPLLTEWHPRLQNWERENTNDHEMNWPARHDFRDALNETREELRQYASVFAEVADVPELTQETDAADTTA